jgi:hypothetical protein
MLHASVLTSNALTARDHADRAKRLLRMSSVTLPLNRRAGTLEEAAARMELEAKAILLRRWRGQTLQAMAAWEPSTTRAAEVPYVGRRQVLRQLRATPPHAPAGMLGYPQHPEPTIDWNVLAVRPPRAEGMPRPSASMRPA